MYPFRFCFPRGHEKSQGSRVPERILGESNLRTGFFFQCAQDVPADPLRPRIPVVMTIKRPLSELALRIAVGIWI
jgi:hypothetical protein